MASGAEFGRLVLERIRRVKRGKLEETTISGKWDTQFNHDVEKFVSLVEEAHRKAGTGKGGPSYKGYGVAFAY